MNDTEHDQLKDAAVSIRAGGVRVSIPAALVLSLVTLCGGGMLGASLAKKDAAPPAPEHLEEMREIKVAVRALVDRVGRVESAVETQTSRIDGLYKAGK